jgi:hypothetical protein
MTTPFQCLKDLNTGLGLCLGDATRDAKSGIYVNHRGTPELSAFVGFGVVFL